MGLAAIFSIASSAALAVFLTSACGGNSFSGDDAPRGGSGNSAGSSAGTHSQGGSATGGVATTGGSATGGVATTGGSATGGVATGGSGPGGEACNAPPEGGNCDGALQRWFHEPATGLCRPFIYGGCGGNDNNYQTFEACQAACPGGTPNFDACSAPTDCMVTGDGCCGICDAPNLAVRGLVAINKKHALDLQQCAFLAAPPGDIPACAPCPPVSPDSGSLRYMVPDCVQGQCAVVDVRSSPLSACVTDDDCRVRNGNDCCESCDVAEPIAVNTSGAFEKLVCGLTSPGCPECEPPATGAVAFCGDTGHCQLAYAAAAH